jgi:hypothetical protein
MTFGAGGEVMRVKARSNRSAMPAIDVAADLTVSCLEVPYGAT